MSHPRRAYLIALLLALLVITGTTSITLVDEASADSLTIVDYDYEGIIAGTTQYFVLWNQGTKTFDMQVNTR